MEFMVFGIPAAALTVALVELLKRLLDLSGKRAILAAVIVGLVLSLGNQFMGVVPGFAIWYEAIVAGLVTGMMACGVYDAVHKG